MIEDTKNVLNKYKIRLDKNKSQNYLIDSNKLNNILNFADIKEDEKILEIGAGIGTLTIPLSKQAKEVITIEKDEKIVEILKERLTEENINNVTVICADALKIDFPEFDKVVANLPYQISSPVTFKLLNYSFKKAILMYQLEFAKRMNAKVNTKEYSRLSASLYFRADVRILDTLSPEAFIPKPKVKSAVIELIPKEYELPLLYDDVIRALFQHRNKKVKKALISSAHELNYDKKLLKNKLNQIDNPLFEEKVFKTTPEEIKEISTILEELL